MAKFSSIYPPSASETLVSVIVCFFNPVAEQFREAIESVRAQIHPAWELLLVDNGTTNGSETLADEYAAAFPNIRLFEHPNRENKGPAASRNLGMRQAGGELIAFLDADDFWLPDKLSQQVAAMLEHPEAALSFGGILRWYNEAAGGKKDEIEVHVSTLEILPPGELVHRLLRNKCIPGMSALMVRRSAVKSSNFEESLLWAEDQTISYKIGLLHPCLVLPDWKVKYRQHAASTTTGVIADGRLFADHLHFLKWVRQFFLEAQVEDPQLWRELDQLQAQYRRLVIKEKMVPRFVRSVLRRLRGK